ncbi:uncharacterized protein BKA78DRAFT_164636 [Phyllosticta capitalensis]|uniref:uncharacterized protein n=1 Tax=Phyllosticta capitalensis TaxID=121624 RepID=UPI0031309FFF
MAEKSPECFQLAASTALVLELFPQDSAKAFQFLLLCFEGKHCFSRPIVFLLVKPRRFAGFPVATPRHFAVVMAQKFWPRFDRSWQGEAPQISRLGNCTVVEDVTIHFPGIPRGSLGSGSSLMLLFSRCTIFGKNSCSRERDERSFQSVGRSFLELPRIRMGQETPSVLGGVLSCCSPLMHYRGNLQADSQPLMTTREP